MALQSIGRVPAMLNFSAGPVNVLAAMKAAQVKTVLTSKAFIEKGKLDKLIAAIAGEARMVYLEDVRAGIGIADKIRGLLAGTKPRVARDANDPAVILFTSGSEGTPKGVVLSHRNILANAAQALARVDANANDMVFNVLPVFHSFGLTGGMIMPLLAGIPIFMYPSPLHYRIVPELIYQTGATILFGTDTFLAGYARSAHAYDFRTLRLVVAGAEAVKDRTRQVYMERYGIRVLEGYGVTETAPVLAMNTPMFNRPGTVGRLSPLMEYRLDPVPGIDEGGRLSVRGPNVMLGYLRAENPGVLEPLAEGPAPSKLAVQPCRKDRHRPAVGIVGRIDHELIIRRQREILVDGVGVIGLENPLVVVVEPAVADQETEAAGGEEIAMRAGEPVDGAAESDRIVRTAPIASLHRQARRQAAVDVGERQDFVAAVVPAQRGRTRRHPSATCCSPLT